MTAGSEILMPVSTDSIVVLHPIALDDNSILSLVVFLFQDCVCNSCRGLAAMEFGSLHSKWHCVSSAVDS